MTRLSKGVLLIFLMAFMALAPVAMGADSDGDGFDDSVDDCPWSAGTSTVDRDGCPDKDGDGISDFSDSWAINNPNFQNEWTLNSNSDYHDVEYSPSGEFIVTGSEDGFVRVWNATTHINIRSANAISGGEVTSVAFSPDGQYVAAGLDDDTMDIYYATNLASVHGTSSGEGGSGD